MAPIWGCVGQTQYCRTSILPVSKLSTSAKTGPVKACLLGILLNDETGAPKAKKQTNENLTGSVDSTVDRCLIWLQSVGLVLGGIKLIPPLALKSPLWRESFPGLQWTPWASTLLFKSLSNVGAIIRCLHVSCQCRQSRFDSSWPQLSKHKQAMHTDIYIQGNKVHTRDGNQIQGNT